MDELQLSLQEKCLCGRRMYVQPYPCLAMDALWGVLTHWKQESYGECQIHQLRTKQAGCL